MCGIKPWEMDRLSMRDIEDVIDAWQWSQEQAGTIAWLYAGLLQLAGSEIPWTARTVLGRDPQ